MNQRGKLRKGWNGKSTKRHGNRRDSFPHTELFKPEIKKKKVFSVRFIPTVPQEQTTTCLVRDGQYQ